MLRALLWFRRKVVVRVLGLLGHFDLLPAPMQLEWLHWLASDMGPTHPNLATVLLEISEREVRRVA